MPLSATQILAARDRQTAEVHVPEWATPDGDDTVLVGSMGALDYAALQTWIDQAGHRVEPEEDEVVTCDSDPAAAEPAEKEYSFAETVELMVRWCCHSILDPKTLMPAFTVDQVQALGSKNVRALERVYQAALQLNRATAESAEAFEKNLEGTAASASGSA